MPRARELGLGFGFRLGPGPGLGFGLGSLGQDFRGAPLVQGPDGPQAADGFFAANRNLSLGAFPIHHGRDADSSQDAQFRLRKAQPLAQGAHAFSRDPKALPGLKLFRARHRLRHGLPKAVQFFPQGDHLAPQVRDQSPPGRIDPLDRSQGFLDLAAGQSGNFRFQFFHHRRHKVSLFCRRTGRRFSAHHPTPRKSSAKRGACRIETAGKSPWAKNPPTGLTDRPSPDIFASDLNGAVAKW